MSELKSLIVSSADGYALHQDRQPEYFKIRLSSLSRFEKAFAEMLAEYYILDDTLPRDVHNFMKFCVLQNETIVSVCETEVVAIAVIHVRQPGRSAELLAWINPKFRKGFRNQKMVRTLIREALLPYLWQKLKLVRVETRCAVLNNPALAVVRNIGFNLIGLARLDLLIQGHLYDSVLLELLNPAYTLPPEEVISHGNVSATAEPSAEQDNDEGLRGSVECLSATSGGERSQSETSDEGRSTSRQDASGLHAAERAEPALRT